ncbi:MAG: hypothetical protein U1B80_06450 [Anaerolineaceae bacterium]|nr:hypothetical protein [Anaerolineaceae bacterium]
MLSASRRLFLPLTLLALATLALHLSITEFFLGAELLRPALLWLTVSQSTQRPLERLRAVLRMWLPYLVVLAGFLIWRLGYINFPDGEPHPLKFFERLAVQPATALLVLFERVVADTTYIILASWSQVIDLDLMNLNRPFTWLSWMAGIATLLGLMVYFHRLRFFDNGSEQEGDWCLPAALLGALGVLIGPVPVWVLDDSLLQFIDPDHADRFALASMVGACMLWVAFIEWAAQGKGQKIFIFCLGLSLAVGFNLRNANTYRWKWEEQKNLYWQLAWRAPNLEPDTAILAENILFPYQGLFATSSAVNLLYPQPDAAGDMAYWVYSLLPARQHTTPGTVDYRTHFRLFRFETSSQNAILIMPPAQFSNCVWVLSEHDRHNPYLSDLVKRCFPHRTSSASRRSRITLISLQKTFLAGNRRINGATFIRRLIWLGRQKIGNRLFVLASGRKRRVTNQRLIRQTRRTSGCHLLKATPAPVIGKKRAG